MSGRTEQVGRGWVATDRREGERERRKLQMSTQCSQLGPKCGERGQEGKAREELQ